MRIITHDTRCHNVGRGFLVVLLLAFFILALNACSKDAGTGEQPSAGTADQPSDCAQTIDTSAWTAFKELAGRIEGGQNVTKKELDAFGDLPAVALWRNSLQPKIPSAKRVGNWLEGTFWKELGREGIQKVNPNRKEFVRSYRYSLDNRGRIDELLAEMTGPRQCDLAEMAQFWIEPHRLPDSLAIHFLPAKAEIRIFEGSLLVDTGVLGATSADQLIRNMAGLYFRKYQSLLGPAPTQLEGETAVAHSFRLLMNEGVIGWIEQTTTFEFDSKHPVLYDVIIIPEKFFLKTQEAIGLMNRQLGPMLDNEAVMTEKGLALARHLIAMNAISQTGYGMCAVISARLGQDGLRDASRSVPAFLAAYQEAALKNPVPAPAPGKSGVELFQTVPPLDPEIFTKLHALLTRVFPE